MVNFRQAKGFLVFSKFYYDGGQLIQLHVKSQLLCSSMLREVEGKVHTRFTSSAMLKKAIRKPQLAKYNLVSTSHPISLDLKLFSSMHPHSWCSGTLRPVASLESVSFHSVLTV